MEQNGAARNRQEPPSKTTSVVQKTASNDGTISESKLDQISSDANQPQQSQRPLARLIVLRSTAPTTPSVHEIVDEWRGHRGWQGQ